MRCVPRHILLAGALLICSLAAQARDLSIEQRIEAQRAIERVYYAYLIDADAPFEVAVSDDLLRKRVQRYLQQTIALERFWHLPITATALDRELERIARTSYLPGRLQEVYDALGRDAFLIRECFARAILVERLTQHFLQGDTRFADADAETWWQTVSPELPLESVRPAPGGNDRLPGSGSRRAFDSSSTQRSGAAPFGNRASCPSADSWLPGSTLDGALSERTFHTAVWTGSEMIVWGGDSPGVGFPDRAARYDPLTNTWRSVSTLGAPGGRRSHSAVWTGSEMIVWGGTTGGQNIFDTGGRYDPLSDSWSATSTVDAPSPRQNHTALWTGSEMLVWGGSTAIGGRYDPSTDTWTEISSIDAPASSSLDTAVWTGSEMIVLGGFELNAGGRYSPATDTWAPMSLVDGFYVPDASVVWSGSEVLVWGGGGNPRGARYNPATDAWSGLSTVGDPIRRFGQVTVWTGTEMLVWGGGFACGGDCTTLLNSGGRYDPVSDSWSPLTIVGAPPPRLRAAGVWTGQRLIVWGGDADYGAAGSILDYFDSGGRYDPDSNTWTPTSDGVGLVGDVGHSAVWTGNQMIVWGGRTGTGVATNAGARYDPVTDHWHPTSTADAPAPRLGHGAVWTGTEMLVWGGVANNGVSRLGSGGRYDPLDDRWEPMSTAASPSPRVEHTSIWTGTEMIVWGGEADGAAANTGGRYDPAADTWSPTSTLGAPSARTGHTSVWTVGEMIVWGGDDGVPTNTGGRYDPTTDSWVETSRFHPPQPRSAHSAVWTGDTMIVWGGAGGSSSGGRYAPSSDSWLPTSMLDAPSPRQQHTAVWTGTEMIVWGGAGDDSTGGRYDPIANAWNATSVVDAPRGTEGNTSIWSGDLMLVWGGGRASGGRYLAGVSTDADGDGRCGFADCDDTNGQVWATAGPVQGLGFTDRQTLVWSDPVLPGGDVVAYDTLRSGDPADFLLVGECVEASDGSDNVAADAGTPASGALFHYLVRPENACPLGTGSLGADSAGHARTGLDCQ